LFNVFRDTFFFIELGGLVLGSSDAHSGRLLTGVDRVCIFEVTVDSNTVLDIVFLEEFYITILFGNGDFS